MTTNFNYCVHAASLPNCVPLTKLLYLSPQENLKLSLFALHHLFNALSASSQVALPPTPQEKWKPTDKGLAVKCRNLLASDLPPLPFLHT